MGVGGSLVPCVAELVPIKKTETIMMFSDVRGINLVSKNGDNCEVPRSLELPTVYNPKGKSCGGEHSEFVV